MSTRSADSRDHSPDAPDGSAEKRASKKRKVLSCYACRNRKMKCDRVYPVCGRCQKTGRAAQCTYDPRLLEESSITGDIRRDGRGIDADDTYENAASGAANTSSALFNAHTQDRRLDVVEQILAIIQDAKGFTSTHPGPPGPEIGEVIMFRGKGLNTHFYGSTSPYSLITQVKFSLLLVRLDHAHIPLYTILT